MLASPVPPSFLYTYSLSTLSLRCNALCMVISFLVLWSIFLCSSLVHLRKGPKYLTRDTAQVFIPLNRFLLGSFLVLLRYSFRIVSFICTCLMVFLNIILPVRRLKYQCNCFSFHFCFLVCFSVVIAVTGNCEQCFFDLFNVVLESLYKCIYAIFSAGVGPLTPFV